VNNRAAELPASLPFRPLEWSTVTMFVDPRGQTTATLYGNDIAMQAVQARGTSGSGIAPAYPAGAVLALVTWAQRDDPHWFGARIPDVPQSVEFVQVTAAGAATSYRSFAGSALVENHPAASMMTERTNLIVGLAPARLP
jgi:cytochrome P460